MPSHHLACPRVRSTIQNDPMSDLKEYMIVSCVYRERLYPGSRSLGSLSLLMAMVNHMRLLCSRFLRDDDRGDHGSSRHRLRAEWPNAHGHRDHRRYVLVLTEMHRVDRVVVIDSLETTLGDSVQSQSLPLRSNQRFILPMCGLSHDFQRHTPNVAGPGGCPTASSLASRTLLPLCRTKHVHGVKLREMSCGPMGPQLPLQRSLNPVHGPVIHVVEMLTRGRFA
jgi:hypothetical protein